MSSLLHFLQSLPTALQWLGVLGFSAVPLIESHGAAMFGVLAGIPLPVAVLLAVIGNIAVVVVLVAGADRVRSRLTAGKEPTRRQAKVARALDRWGVIPVCLFGQMMVPNQIVAPTLVALGVDAKRVVVWQSAGIVLWGCVFAGLGAAGLYAVA